MASLLYLWLMFLPLLGATVITVALGRVMWQGIRDDHGDAPRWLEAIAPLKGRWLSYFLAAPGFLIFLAAVFCISAAGIAIPLFAVGSLVFMVLR
jgi:hypothetical protein